MKHETTNKGYLKTEMKIFRSFFDLLAERGAVNKISVKNVCDAAEIRRSTFYIHFANVEDITNQLSMNYFDGIKKVIPEKISNAEDLKVFFHNYIKMHKERSIYIRPLLLSGGISFFEDVQNKVRLEVRKAMIAGGAKFDLGAVSTVLLGMMSILDRILVGKTYATHEDVENATMTLAPKLFD